MCLWKTDVWPWVGVMITADSPITHHRALQSKVDHNNVQNKTIEDGGIPVDFWSIKVHTPRDQMGLAGRQDPSDPPDLPHPSEYPQDIMRHCC